LGLKRDPPIHFEYSYRHSERLDGITMLENLTSVLRGLLPPPSATIHGQQQNPSLPPEVVPSILEAVGACLHPLVAAQAGHAPPTTMNPQSALAALTAGRPSLPSEFTSVAAMSNGPSEADHIDTLRSLAMRATVNPTPNIVRVPAPDVPAPLEPQQPTGESEWKVEHSCRHSSGEVLAPGRF